MSLALSAFLGAGYASTGITTGKINVTYCDNCKHDGKCDENCKKCKKGKCEKDGNKTCCLKSEEGKASSEGKSDGKPGCTAVTSKKSCCKKKAEASSNAVQKEEKKDADK